MRLAEADQVRSIPLFQDMADEHFEDLVRGAYLQRFPAQVQLIAEYDRPDFLHIVMEGAVELHSHQNGRETTISICRPFNTFILAAVARDRPYLASGRTIEPSRILMLPAEAVRSAFDRDGAFARAIVLELSDAFRTVMKELKSHKLRNSTQRLANWIIATDRQHGGNGRFSLPFEKRTLAAQLGMTPENLSRSLNQLSAHGVKTTRRELIIEDPAKLLEYAKPTPSIDEPNY